MSKLNGLIGFWNSKSTEAETPPSPVPRPTVPRPTGRKIRKWENGQQFVNSLECSKDQGATSMRARGSERLARPASGCYRDSDERLKGPAKCYEKDLSLSKLDKSEKEVFAAPFGDASDKIVHKKPFDRDSDAIKRREEDTKESDRKMKAELFREERAEFELASGMNSDGCLKERPSFSAPSSPRPERSPKSPINSTSVRDRQDKPISPFARFKQLENDQTQSSLGLNSTLSPPMPARATNLYRNSSLPASPRPTITHAQMLTPGHSTGTLAARSGSGAKEIILTWVQDKLKDYPIPMTNFSTHWNDGLAFCALIHVFYPEDFDWFALKAENRRDNFTLGFEKAESLAGIYPLLEVDDMVRFKKPDWKCVFTYVQSFYRRFRDERLQPKSVHKIPDKSKVSSNFSPTPPLIQCHLVSTEDPILDTEPPKDTEEATITPNPVSHTDHTDKDQQPADYTKSTSLGLISSKARSKSVASNPPTIAEKLTSERKFSFNNLPDTVSFTTRQ